MNKALSLYQVLSIAEYARTPYETLGAVADYDQIKIGGNYYSANQIVDKTITAKSDTKYYSSRPFLKDGKIANGTLLGTIKAGQPIGKVYSYVRASQAADGRVWLWVENGTKVLWVPDEAVAPQTLKDQGTLTISEEVKKEEEDKLKDESPLEYYFVKYGWKILGTGAAIYVAVQLGKTFLEKKIKST